MSELLRRIERDAGVPGLTELLAGLAPADLRSLALEVMRAHAAARDPASLLAQYADGGAMAPEPVDGRALHALDGLALDAADGFESVQVSPVTPLGLNAVLGRIDQNNVLSTIRNSEVLADPTASLALEAALRRRAGEDVVRLCVLTRVMRLQTFDMPGFMPHFRLFALVSAGRARPDHAFEIEEVATHLRVYKRLLGALGLSGDASVAGPLAERVGVRVDPDRTSTYYDGLMLRIDGTDRDGTTYQLADGGTVDWTQRLLANRKERLVTSGFGLGLTAARFL